MLQTRPGTGWHRSEGLSLGAVRGLRSSPKLERDDARPPPGPGSNLAPPVSAPLRLTSEAFCGASSVSYQGPPLCGEPQLCHLPSRRGAPRGPVLPVFAPLTCSLRLAAGLSCVQGVRDTCPFLGPGKILSLGGKSARETGSSVSLSSLRGGWPARHLRTSP